MTSNRGNTAFPLLTSENLVKNPVIDLLKRQKIYYEKFFVSSRGSIDLIYTKKKTANRLCLDTPNNGINFLNTSDFRKNVLNNIYSLCRRDETSFSRKHKGMSLLALNLWVLCASVVKVMWQKRTTHSYLISRLP